ncbi:hypothetical protein ACQ9ZF_11925 (plasmid) [Cetobacterium somerae]|uniref:hypothetical protein n=1 Tax=Cetobacterium somerae TaxID=188913 RepID=UPI003D769949
MKKLLLIIGCVIFLGGCTEDINPDAILSKQFNPYKEYKINDTNVAKTVEEGILSTEAKDKGLNLETSSAHLISYRKLGEYGTGEIRILGYFTTEGLNKVNEERKYNSKIENNIINYTCTFEYSYKTGRFTWTSNFPY